MTTLMKNICSACGKELEPLTGHSGHDGAISIGHRSECIGGATVKRAEFSHPANGEGGWLIEMSGTEEELQSDAMARFVEANAREHGWTDTDRAWVGYLTQWNLRTYTRQWVFYGKGTWEHHADCWCQRHRG